jgi:tyrosyl-tRNA synthetase
LIHLASNFTVQQFLTRENFRQRFDQNEAIFVHEFFYALMQAYDAFHLKADVQVGGTDQLFNIVTAGRKLMSAQGAAPNIGIIMDILPGTDGEVKMSKSLGNHIPLNTDAVDMYGKVMSVPDAAMPLYYRLVTRWDAGEVDQRLAKIESGEVHPRDAKMAVAYEITEIFYGTQEARRAQEEFVRVFQQGDVPDEIDEYKLKPGQTVLDVMEAAGLVESRGAGRRLIDQNAVSLDGEKLGDANAEFPGEGILRVGKRRFVSVRK